MSRPLKRSLERPISPPPLRRKLKQAPCAEADESTTISVNSPVQTPHSSQAFKVLSWNINGIQAFLPRSRNQKSIHAFFPAKPSPTAQKKARAEEKDEQTLRTILRRHGFPPLLCLQEVKINNRDLKTQLAAEKTLLSPLPPSPAKESPEEERSDEPEYRMYFSLPTDPHNGRGFGGRVWGVATCVRSDLVEEGKVGQTEKAGWDSEGRVLITTVLRPSSSNSPSPPGEIESDKGSKGLKVINGYWPNGTTSAWKDAQFGHVIGTRHDAKRLFHTNMLAHARSLEEDGWAVLLTGDMNIAPTPLDGYPGIRTATEHTLNRADFNRKFLDDTNEEGMKGIDTFRHVHGKLRMFSYHGERAEEWGRSCDRVDLCILSRSAVERGVLLGAWIWESPEERATSDHVPIEVVVNLGKL